MPSVIAPWNTSGQRKRKKHDKEREEEDEKTASERVVRVTDQRAPCIVPGLSVGRERRPGPPLSVCPPCFMHSVLCDDKHQRGGWNAGLRGPGEELGWRRGQRGGRGAGVLHGSKRRDHTALPDIAVAAAHVCAYAPHWPSG